MFYLSLESIFSFFQFKYQINVDGTVAAYRMPYLLAGGGLVLKQQSPYYEHFYSQLVPWEHFVPVKRDLSDLVDRVKWARDNDDKAQQIAVNARNFANNNLLPQDVICYHAALFWVCITFIYTCMLTCLITFQYVCYYKITPSNYSIFFSGMEQNYKK